MLAAYFVVSQAWATPASPAVATRVASQWLRAVMDGNSGRVERLSARTIQLRFDDEDNHREQHPDLHTHAQFARVVPQLRRLVQRWFHRMPIARADSEGGVSFSTMDESFMTVEIHVNAAGRVTEATMRVSYGGH